MSNQNINITVNNLTPYPNLFRFLTGSKRADGEVNGKNKLLARLNDENFRQSCNQSRL